MKFLNQKGVTHLLLLILLLLGILVTVWAVKTPTFFLPKASSSVSFSSDNYGVNAGGVVEHDPQLSSAFTLAKNAGIGWARTEGCNWEDILSKDPGTTPPYPANVYNFSKCDSFISDIVSHNHLKLLTNFYYSTSWCSASPAVGTLNLGGGVIGSADISKAPPCDYNKFYDFVYKLVARYGSTAHPELGSDYGKGLIKYFEVGNEPDGSGAMLYYTFGKSVPPTVSDAERWSAMSSNYAHLLKVAHDAIKKADPNAQVVLGGLIIGSNPDPDFFNQILTDPIYPAANNFDIMNYHCYCDIAGADQKFSDVYHSLKAVGAEGKPFWVTETGYGSIASEQNKAAYKCSSSDLPDSECRQQEQAKYLADLIPHFLLGTQVDGILIKADKVFWYSLLDSPADNSSFCSYGLIWYGSTSYQCGATSILPTTLPALVTKSAYITYQSLTGNPQPSSSFSPTPKPTVTPTPNTSVKNSSSNSKASICTTVVSCPVAGDNCHYINNSDCTCGQLVCSPPEPPPPSQTPAPIQNLINQVIYIFQTPAPQGGQVSVSTPAPEPSSSICNAQITAALNLATGQCSQFATNCDIPAGWQSLGGSNCPSQTPQPALVQTPNPTFQALAGLPEPLVTLEPFGEGDQRTPIPFERPTPAPKGSIISQFFAGIGNFFKSLFNFL